MSVRTFVLDVQNSRHMESRYTEHLVQDGETIRDLSELYGNSQGAIRAINGGLNAAPYNTGALDAYVGSMIYGAFEVAPALDRGVLMEEMVYHHLANEYSHLTIEALAEANEGRGPFHKEGTWIRVPLPFVPNREEVITASNVGYSLGALSVEHVEDVAGKELTFQGRAPAYDDDILPAHRLEGVVGATLIGDVYTVIPPEFISVRKATQTQQALGIRSNTPMVTTDGREQTEVHMSLYFTGEDGINGIKVPSPWSDRPYEMDGLRAFVAQAHAMPFLPVANEFLNDTLGIHALAVASMTVRTVEGFPHTFRVDLVGFEFNPYPYLLAEANEYGHHIIWPLFRWHYQKFLRYSRFESRRYFAPYSAQEQPFRLSVLDADTMYEEDELPFYLDEDWKFSQEEIWDDFTFPESTILDASFGMMNVLTNMPMQGLTSPLHQYMGSVDDRMHLVLETDNQDEVHNLVEIKRRIDRYAREYRNHSMSNQYRFHGYLRLHWDIAKSMGFSHCILEQVEVETIPNYPDAYRVTLTMQAFDPLQHEREFVEGVTGSQHEVFAVDLEGTQNAMEQDIVYESQLNRFNLYPDLQLPRYHELRTAVHQIQRFRSEHGLPTMDVHLKYLEDQRFNNHYVEPDFYFAYQIDAIWEDFQDASRENNLHEGFFVVDPYEAAKTATVPLLQELPHRTEEQMITSMWHDEFHYEARGRMARAFPTYMMLFVDEGRFVDGRRLWDIPYVLRSAINIMVHEEEYMPISSCHVVMHDVYGATNLPRWRRQVDQTFWQRFFPTIDDQMIETRRTLLKQRMLSVQAGARLHLRMGYGSLSQSLPITFNGTIAEISTGPEVEVIAQSDGAELIEMIPDFIPDSTEGYKNTGLGLGTGPAELLENLLGHRQTILYNFTHRWGKESPYGVNHFGFVSKDGLRALPMLGRQNREEIGKNLYSVLMRDLDESVQRDMPFNDRYLNPPTPEQDNEKHLQVWLHQKSIWDVAMILEGAAPDFSFDIVPHQFRSTAFFGMPHWPVRYGFTTNRAGDIMEKYKTKTQFHKAINYVDLISNNMRSSAMDIKTIAHFTYHEGGNAQGRGLKQDHIMADKSIRTDRQKPFIVDTGIVQDYGSFRLPIVNWNVDVLADGGLNFLGIRHGYQWARNAARNALAQRMSLMYTGQIAMVGGASLRPKDLLYLNDDMQDMVGTVGVGAVTKSLSVEGGFQMVIRPTLLTGTRDAAWSRLAMGAAAAAGTIGVFAARNYLAKLGLKVTTGYGAKVVTSAAAKAATSTAGVGAATLAGKALHTTAATTIATAIKGGAAAPAVVALLGFKALPLIVTGVLIYFGVRRVLRFFEDTFNRSAGIILLPIFFRGAPYVAGIDGHENLIPGWDDAKITEAMLDGSPVDELIEAVAALPEPTPEEIEELYPDDGFIDTLPEGPPDAIETHMPADVPLIRNGQLQRAFTWPTTGTRITSPFGPRINPFDSTKQSMHNGIDVGVPTGTPLFAAADGVVTVSQYSNSYGHWVEIDHGDGIRTRYAHNYSNRVRAGETVVRGQHIADSGASGNVTGPHLHFEIRLNNNPVDPLLYLIHP